MPGSQARKELKEIIDVEDDAVIVKVFGADKTDEHVSLFNLVPVCSLSMEPLRALVDILSFDSSLSVSGCKSLEKQGEHHIITRKCRPCICSNMTFAVAPFVLSEDPGW